MKSQRTTKSTRYNILMTIPLNQNLNENKETKSRQQNLHGKIDLRIYSTSAYLNSKRDISALEISLLGNK